MKYYYLLISVHFSDQNHMILKIFIWFGIVQLSHFYTVKSYRAGQLTYSILTLFLGRFSALNG